MPSITAEIVSNNVLQYLLDQMPDDAVLSDPSKFDPQDESKTAWAQLWLSSLNQNIGSNPPTFECSLRGEAYARGQSKLYEHQSLASELYETFDRLSLPLMNLAGNTEIGRLTVRKIRTQDTGQVGMNYQRCTLNIDAFVEEYA